MEIILLERIEKLGQLGDVVHVKDGYARNYLLPQKKALRATEEAHAYFKTERAKIEKDSQSKREGAATLAEQMSGLELVMVRQAGESGQLYGSVSARDIAAAMSVSGYPIDRRQVIINTVIKSLGLYEAQVRLHAEVPVEITVNVARSEEEAKLQAAGGKVTSEAGDGMKQTADIEEILEQAPANELLAGEALAVAGTGKVLADEASAIESSAPIDVVAEDS